MGSGGGWEKRGGTEFDVGNKEGYRWKEVVTGRVKSVIIVIFTTLIMNMVKIKVSKEDLIILCMY